MSRLATRQHGVVAWWQLRDAGIPRAFVDTRLARRRLHIVHRGVYAVGHPVLTREGRWMAAVLLYGPLAVLSHRTAAAHWGMLSTTDSAWVHVTRPGRRGVRPRKGIMLHRPRVLVDATVHDGIPVTTVPQTLQDLAGTVDRHTVDQAVSAAERRGLLDVDEIVAPGRPGVTMLRDVVRLYARAPTRSELERRFLVLCDEAGLPRPEVNVLVAGKEVDFVWRDFRLVVEVDGRSWHDARPEQERDRHKEAALALAGYRVQRFTWLQVTEDGATVVAVLRAVMAA